jgi:hypothetical protein
VIADLRRRFGARFVAQARVRVAKARASLSSDRKVVVAELHALAGEAALLEITDVARAARSGERAVRDAPDSEVTAACTVELDALDAAIAAFEAELET